MQTVIEVTSFKATLAISVYFIFCHKLRNKHLMFVSFNINQNIDVLNKFNAEMKRHSMFLLKWYRQFNNTERMSFFLVYMASFLQNGKKRIIFLFLC